MKLLHYAVTALLLLSLAACAASPQQRAKDAEAAEANARLGIDFLSKGNNEKALERLQRALEYDADHVDANWAIAIVYDRLGELEPAGKYYERAVKLKPRPEIVNGYAVFLCKNGATSKAVENFEKAARNPRYPSPADALANAGLCLDRANQSERAEEYYRAALEANPQHVPSLVHMAELTFRREKPLRTRAFLQRLDGEGVLDGDLLLLAARTELALGNRGAASDYLRRYNADHPGAERALSQLEKQAYE